MKIIGSDRHFIYVGINPAAFYEDMPLPKNKLLTLDSQSVRPVNKGASLNEERGGNETVTQTIFSSSNSRPIPGNMGKPGVDTLFKGGIPKPDPAPGTYRMTHQPLKAKTDPKTGNPVPDSVFLDRKIPCTKQFLDSVLAMSDKKIDALIEQKELFTQRYKRTQTLDGVNHAEPDDFHELRGRFAQKISDLIEAREALTKRYVITKTGR